MKQPQMIKATIALTLGLGLATASNAALVLTNGAFDRTAGSWTARGGGAPDGWSASTQGEDTSYGEAITGYGTGFVAAFKTNPNFSSYVQQTIGLVGEQTGVQVDFLAGYRSHGSYETAAANPRNIEITVSLWDATDNVELASVTKVYTYTDAAAALTSESETLNYTIGAAGAHDLALRFENVSLPLTANFGHTTAIVDTASITAVPEPSSLALLGLGGLGLLRRRRK